MAANQGPQQDRDEQIVLLMQYLYHERFVKEENVPEDKVGFVMPAYFFGWLDKHMNLMNGEEICAAVGVPVEIWTFIKDLVDSGCAVERLHQVWFTIALGMRPQPKTKLERVHLLMLMTWADGTIYPVQVFATQDMLDGPGFNDGLVAAIVAKNTQSFTESIIEHGLDGLHARGKNYRGGTPEDPFDVVMDLMLKHLIPNVRPDLRRLCEDYVRPFQGIVRPVLPPEVRAALDYRKQQFREERETSERGLGCLNAA